jgi:hypothetical protein
MVLPAKDIVEERDKRLKIAGGKIKGRDVLVPKRGKPVRVCTRPRKLWEILEISTWLT